MSMNTGNKDVDLSELMPVQINDWKAVEKDSVYDSDSIFEYIDGAGEVFRAYDFKKLRARHYHNEGHPRIICDLFDMGESRDAFGVFTHDVEGENVGIGQGSLYSGGLLTFWKYKYFISIFAEEETEKTKTVVLALGRQIDASIQELGKVPGVVNLLPQDKLDRGSVRYFHHHLILNYHYFVADENILLLDSEVDGVLGAYADKSMLLIVRYPAVEKTAAAFESFSRAFMPDAAEPGLVKTEDGRWAYASVMQEYLVVVFDALSKDQAKEKAEAVKLSG